MDAKPAAAKPVAPMASEPWDHPLTQQLREHFGDAILETCQYRKQAYVLVHSGKVLELLTYLRDSAGFDAISDLTAADYPDRSERFELVYTLYSYPANAYLRVKTRIAEGEEPASVVGLFAGTNWLEREVFDMFGIRFGGHPDLRRMLLPEDWKGYPLRKDASITGMDQEWVQTHLGIASGQ